MKAFTYKYKKRHASFFMKRASLHFILFLRCSFHPYFFTRSLSDNLFALFLRDVDAWL